MSDPFLAIVNGGSAAPPAPAPRAAPDMSRVGSAQSWDAFAAELEKRGIKQAAGRTGFRTAQDQAEIHAAGESNLDGVHGISRHQTWQAFDPVAASNDPAKAAEAAAAAGLTGFRVVHESGGRVHYQWDGQTGPAAAQAAPVSNDPFISIVNGGNGGGDAPPPQQSGNIPSNGAPGNDLGADQGGTQARPLQAGLPPVVDPAAPGVGRGQPAVSPRGGFGEGVADFYNAVGNAPAELGDSLLGLGTRFTDWTGLSNGAHDDWRRKSDAIHKDIIDPQFNNPDGWARSGGALTGDLITTAPLTAIKPFQALGAVGKLGTAARYGDYAVQGATAGTALSRGDNIGENAAMGTVLGPAIGGAAEKVVGPLVGAAWQKIKPNAANLADAIKARTASSPVEVPVDPTAPPAWLKAGPSEFSTGGYEIDPATGIKYNVDEIVGDLTPPKADPAHLAEAIGSRASKSGVESTRELPPSVAERHARLVEQGVSPGEALREADIRGIPGAQPTVAAVKRTAEDMRAMFEGAKSSSPEGIALNRQIAENNAALHSHVEGMVEGNGGIPSRGDAAQAAAKGLAESADAAKAKVSALYEHARAQDGDKTVGIDAVKELLAKPAYKAPTTAEGKALVNGLRAQIKAMGAENGNRFNPDQIELLNQAANDAYNPMGGGANKMVGDIKAALNESLDQFDAAGPAFKEARAAHRDYAGKYDDPAGVASLIKRDAQGNFVNEDNWRAAEGFINSTSDKKAVQIIRLLVADGKDDAIKTMKASVLQRSYEAASGTASDTLGNATFSGKKWFAELNKIGSAKLNALFDKAEIADLAHVGRASIYMNEVVPGSVKPSGTASVLLDALGKQGKGFSHPKAKAAVHALGQVLELGLHGASPGGNAAAAAISHIVNKGADNIANRVAAKKLAHALTQQMSPETARASESALQKRLADALVRKQSSRRLADETARAGGVNNNRRSQ